MCLKVGQMQLTEFNPKAVWKWLCQGSLQLLKGEFLKTGILQDKKDETKGGIK